MVLVEVPGQERWSAMVLTENRSSRGGGQCRCVCHRAGQSERYRAGHQAVYSQAELMLKPVSWISSSLGKPQILLLRPFDQLGEVHTDLLRIFYLKSADCRY